MFHRVPTFFCCSGKKYCGITLSPIYFILSANALLFGTVGVEKTILGVIERY
jgi:hypothetical protein